MTREDYLVLLLSERDEQLHINSVMWGYSPGWWDKPPLINARSETTPTSRMVKPLWHNMAAQFALLMDGLSGKRKATRSNPTSFTGQTVSRYLWRRSVAHHSNVEIKQKVSL
jgi:putative SOS response-associated peptidase YedK